MNTVKITDHTATIDMAVTHKYDHYTKIRIHAITTGGNIRKAILQGFNGKRWVRAKAKAVKKV